MSVSTSRKKSTVRSLLTPAALLLLFSARFALGEEPSFSPTGPVLADDPVLVGLVNEAIEKLPELAQARSLARADRERAPQAGSLPDPMLQLGVQNDGFTSWEVGKMETSWYSIMISQTLPWPGKLRLRSDVAELGANQADQNVARVRLSTEAEVRRAYLSLILARDRLTLLDRLDAIWQKSAALARIRYETGQGAQSDVFRAQLELNRIQQRRWALQVEADTQVQALNRLRGHPLDEPIATSSHLVDLALPALNDDSVAAQDAFDRSPELAAARLGLPQAEKSVALARKSYLPDLTVSAGVMPRGGDFPPMWLVSVGIPLPIFAGSKQSRAVAEGEARVVANQRNIDAIEQVLKLRIAQRRTAMGTTLETIRLYRDGLLVQSEATTRSTLSQYEVGRVTFASVLEANAGLIADQDGYIQALAQVQRLAIDSFEVSLAPVSSASAGMGTAAMPGAGAANAGASSPSGGTATASPTGGGSSAM